MQIHYRAEVYFSRPRSGQLEMKCSRKHFRHFENGSHRKVPDVRFDVGCQYGSLTEIWATGSELRWWGVDPRLSESRTSPSGATLSEGSADHFPFLPIVTS